MSATAYSTRRFSFAAGHRYWVETWPAAENERVFGRLTVSHGHNYTVDVTVRGPIDERTGMVIDLGELKRIVGETVVDRFDHADLNADPLFRSRVPTTENLALVIWDLLAAKVGAERLWQVRVWEDPTLYVDVRGEARSDEPRPSMTGDVRGEARSDEPRPSMTGDVRGEARSDEPRPSMTGDVRGEARSDEPRPSMTGDVRGEARSDEPRPSTTGVVRGEARSDEPRPSTTGVVRGEARSDEPSRSPTPIVREEPHER